MLFIYIHGFNSSPASYKAQCFEQYLTEHHPEDTLFTPELSDLPDQAISVLSQYIESQPKTMSIALVGSSLGGFYATWLAAQYHLKAVLINPAVNPQELLVDCLGKNTNYHTGEEYEFTVDHIQQLNHLNVHHLKSPKNLMVMLQTHDEVLDYRLAKAKYSNSNVIIEQGGDHSFQKFSQHLEAIYAFLISKACS